MSSAQYTAMTFMNDDTVYGLNIVLYNLWSSLPDLGLHSYDVYYDQDADKVKTRRIGKWAILPWPFPWASSDSILTAIVKDADSFLNKENAGGMIMDMSQDPTYQAETPSQSKPQSLPSPDQLLG